MSVEGLSWHLMVTPASTSAGMFTWGGWVAAGTQPMDILEQGLWSQALTRRYLLVGQGSQASGAALCSQCAGRWLSAPPCEVFQHSFQPGQPCWYVPLCALSPWRLSLYSLPILPPLVLLLQAWRFPSPPQGPAS